MDSQVVQTKKPYTLEQNVEAALAYLLGPVSGAIVYYYNKDSKFLKFHAIQAFLLGMIMWIVVPMLSFILFWLFWYIGSAVGLVLFIAWCYCMWEAYNNREFELPVLGKIAKEHANPLRNS